MNFVWIYSCCLYVYNIIFLPSVLCTNFAAFIPKNATELFRVLENVMLNCLKDSSALLLNGESNNYSVPYKSLFQHLKPVYIFGTNVYNNFQMFPKSVIKYRLDDAHSMSNAWRNYPIAIVIIVVSSHPTFEAIMENVKNSIWWNHEALFLMVNNSKGNSCLMADAFLKTTWEFNILSAVYLCSNTDGQPYMFTFNPYTKSTSKFQFKRIAKRYRLVRYYTSSSFSDVDSEFCNEFYLDKTKNLNNYVVRGARVKNSKYDLERFKIFSSDVCEETHLAVQCIVMKHINARIDVKLTYPGTQVLSYVSSNSVDMSLDNFIMTNETWAQNQAYPYLIWAIKIVSPQNSMDNFQRFSHLFEIRTYFYFFTYFLVIVLLFKYLLNICVSSAVLEFLRLFTGTVTVTIPVKLLDKYFLITALFLAFFLRIYILCKLDADNIAPHLNSVIDSMEDLQHSNFPVYGTRLAQTFIRSQSILKRFHVVDDYRTCAKRLAQGESIACLISRQFLPFYVHENSQVHVSRDDILNRGVAVIFPKDSPLRSKYNQIFTRLWEGGFETLLRQREQYFSTKVMHDDGANSFPTAEILVSYYIFGGGCLLSLAMFIGEIVVTKFNGWIENKIQIRVLNILLGKS